MPNTFGTEGYSYEWDPYKASKPYEKYGAYQTLQEKMPEISQVARDMLSGKLTPAQEEDLSRRLNVNLAATREGAYGMPIGAQKTLEAGQAGTTALQAQLQAEQNRMNAMPFLGLMQGEQQYQYGAGQGEHRYGYQSGVEENRYGQTFNVGQQQFGEQMKAKSQEEQNRNTFSLGNLFSGAIAKGTEFGLGKIFPPAGQNEMEEYYKNKYGVKT